MFSGFYLALLLILVALIVRGVCFEFRSKVDSPRWRGTWDGLLTGGSLLAPLLIGVALGDLLHGLPVNSATELHRVVLDLLQPYGIFTGITFVADLPAARRDVPVPEDHRRPAPAGRPAGPRGSRR